jgi:DNA-binding MarR family transcriptional regulator
LFSVARSSLQYQSKLAIKDAPALGAMRRLYQKDIAAELGVHPKTVRRALARGGPWLEKYRQ